MKKTAVITGISGQDGSYLAEHLLTKNYKVYGLIRRHSDVDHQMARLDHIADSIHVEYGDVTDAVAVEHFIRTVQPDEVYHLAGQSDVHMSFSLPKLTADANAIGTVNILESCRLAARYCKFFHASSSEIFGNNKDEDGKQRETTTIGPTSPYGCSKLYAHYLVKNYRSAYKMFCVNGIMFNHESPRRSANFVTMKVIRAAKAIKEGKQINLPMGCLDASRDWGHAKDYVAAMHLMMHHKEPDDFVVASNESHTIQELCEYVFKKFDLDYTKYVTTNKDFVRPMELKHQNADSSKAREVLGWRPNYTWKSMLNEIIKSI